MADHDGGYKSLFAHARMVEDLLRGFVHEPWIDDLDFSSLERCEGSYVSEKFRRFEQDMVWRIQWKRSRTDAARSEPPGLYVYLLLEFQSQVDGFMALRMLTYLSLFYQDLMKRRELTPSGKLPPVLPLVLYNGKQRWTAPREVADLIEEVPGGLAAYRPSLRYLLLDEGEYPESELELPENLAAALFRLEQSRDWDEAQTLIGGLAPRMREPSQGNLRRAFEEWLAKVLLPSRFPKERIPEWTKLEGSQTMLRESVLEWTREWREEGEQKLLLRQLERKFGALDAAARRRIENAEEEQLVTWGENLLSAETLEDVFAS